MAIYHATADPKLKIEGKQYSMFIGRWQPWHSGHRWLIDQRLNEGKNVLICIRDIKPDEKNPFTAQQVLENITEFYQNEPRVKVMVIPDICSIEFGRGVGYKIEEIVLPKEIQEISATKIRKEMRL